MSKIIIESASRTSEELRELLDGCLHETSNLDEIDSEECCGIDDLIIKDDNQTYKMKMVLIYENRKTDPVVWDASTSELEGKAFLSLFNLLDKEWRVYTDLEENPQSSMFNNQFTLYNKSKEGDIRSCRALLNIRKQYEYEYWSFVRILEE